MTAHLHTQENITHENIEHYLLNTKKKCFNRRRSVNCNQWKVKKKNHNERLKEPVRHLDQIIKVDNILLLSTINYNWTMGITEMAVSIPMAFNTEINIKKWTSNIDRLSQLLL